MRRDRLGQIIDILRQISLHRGCKYTHLMLYANVAYDAIHAILELLEEKGMIRIENVKRGSCIFIEPKGGEWLRTINGLLRQIDYEIDS